MFKRTLFRGSVLLNSIRKRNLTHMQKLYCLDSHNFPLRVLVKDGAAALQIPELRRNCASVAKDDIKMEQNLPQWKPKLIVFDKNGTLHNFHNTWIPWVKSFEEKLEDRSGLQLKEKLYNKLDVCTFTDRAKTGLMGHGSMDQIKQAVLELLIDEGIPSGSARSITDECWEECDVTSPEAIKEFFNLKELFSRIQEAGIKIAICTSDTRDKLEKTMKTLDISNLVDIMRCSDDGVCKVKPDPDNIHSICSELGVKPEDAVMIGDSESDVIMGHDAGSQWISWIYGIGVGLTVGVLSGIGARLDLAHYSDYVVEDITQFVNMMIPTADQDITVHKPLVKRLEKCDDPSKNKASLVIFDKDGTLLCFHSMWTPWAKDLVQSLEKETSLNLEEQLLAGLGYCEESQKWIPGLFAQGTTHQNKEMVKSLLQSKGMDEDKAHQAIEKVWKHGNHDLSSDEMRLLDNPAALFRILKENGVKIAICTSDSREGTLQFVKSIGAEDYIDLVLCGDDPTSEPKPSPKNAIEICRTLGVDPSKAVVVGDTLADMGMGKSAKLGATVAVLSGVGDVKHLQDSADHVVPSISHILPVVFRKSDQQTN